MRWAELGNGEHAADSVQKQPTVKSTSTSVEVNGEGQDQGGSRIPPGPKPQFHQSRGPALPWSLDPARFLFSLLLCDPKPLDLKSARSLPSWGLTTARRPSKTDANNKGISHHMPCSLPPTRLC